MNIVRWAEAEPVSRLLGLFGGRWYRLVSEFRVPRAVTDRSAPRTLHLLAIATACFLLLRLLGPTRDPWLDEAMLALNIKAISLAGVFRPLPLYEQASPPGYLAVCFFVRALFTDDALVTALRGVSVAAMIGAVYLMIRLAAGWEGLRSALVVAAFVLASDLLMSYGVELKHYAAEGLASAVVLAAGHSLSQAPTVRSGLRFVTVAAMANLISFTAPIPTAAVLGSTFVIRWWSSGKNAGTPAAPATREWLPIWLASAGSAGICIFAIKLFITDPLTTLQFSAYPDAYNTWLDAGATFGANMRVLEILVVRLYEFVYLNTFFELGLGPTGRHFGVAVAAGAIASANVIAARKNPYVVLTGAALVATIVVLNAARLFPIAYTRHLLFAAPILLIPLALASVELLDLVAKRVNALARAGAAGVLFACLGGLATLATYRTLRADKVDESRLVREALRTNPDVPMWVYFGGQPTVRLIAPPDIRFIGLLDDNSKRESWFRRAGVMSRNDPRGDTYLADFHRVLQGRRSVWLLFSHTSLYVRPEQSLTPYLTIAETAVGGCALRSSTNRASLYLCESHDPARATPR